MVTVLLLTALLGVTAAMTALGVGAGLVIRAVAERSRLHPSVETGAPLLWVWSPRAPARLHRRLQGVVDPLREPARAGGSGDHATADLVGSLIGAAAAVDRELIGVSRNHGPQRRSQLRRLRADVRRLEVLSRRLRRYEMAVAATASGVIAAAPRRTVLDELHTRLDLLTDAHAELAAIEQASTASDPDRLLACTAPRPTPAPAGPVRRPRRRAV